MGGIMTSHSETTDKTMTMYNVIFDEGGHAVHTGRDLRVFNRYAKEYGGVKSIDVEKFWHSKTYRWIVSVGINYANGFFGRADFDSFDDAKKWALRKSAKGGPNWVGCVVTSCWV